MRVWAALAPEAFLSANTSVLLDAEAKLPPISPLALIVYPRALDGQSAPVLAGQCDSSAGIFRVRSSGTDDSELVPARLRPGSHAFVRMPGEDFLRVGVATGRFGDMCGHLVISGGAPVLFAGELEVNENCRVVRWSNKSGSFRPAAWAAETIALDPALFVPYEEELPGTVPLSTSAPSSGVSGVPIPRALAAPEPVHGMQLERWHHHRSHSLPVGNLGIEGLPKRTVVWPALKPQQAPTRRHSAVSECASKARSAVQPQSKCERAQQQAKCTGGTFTSSGNNVLPAQKSSCSRDCDTGDRLAADLDLKVTL